MADSTLIETLQTKCEALRPLMSERLRRHWAATEARALGRGGIATIMRATGLSRNTIVCGRAELGLAQGVSTPESARTRRLGGGRKPVMETDPTLLQDLEALVEPSTRGDPMSPLRWTCKSTRTLAEELQRQGHRVGARTVSRLLHDLD